MIGDEKWQSMATQSASDRFGLDPDSMDSQVLAHSSA